MPHMLAPPILKIGIRKAPCRIRKVLFPMQLNPRRYVLDAFQQSICFLHRRVLLKVLHAAKRDGRVYRLEVIRIAAQGNRFDAVDVARLVEHEHDVHEPLLRDLEMLCRELRPVGVVMVEVLVQKREYLVDQLEVRHDATFSKLRILVIPKFLLELVLLAFLA